MSARIKETANRTIQDKKSISIVGEGRSFTRERTERKQREEGQGLGW